MRRTPRDFVPPAIEYDLEVTHIYFYCLIQPELDGVVDRVAPSLAPGARWVVSEFARGRGRAGSVVSSLVVSEFYRAFGLLAALHVRTLPEHGIALERAGFHCLSERRWLMGLLMSLLWQH